MKVDLYTKIILAVIAGSLIWLCVAPAVRPQTVAAQGPQKVIIVGVQSTGVLDAGAIPIKIIGGTKYDNLEISRANPLAVEVESK